MTSGPSISISILIPEPNPYYSYQDEYHFFQWLEGLDAFIDACRVKGGLSVDLKSPIDNDSLADLTSLLMRYSLDMKCLSDLIHEGNVAWFKDPKNYWHDRVFGGDPLINEM